MDAAGAVSALSDRLAATDWASDLWVAGSWASGDHVPGVSDLDLVAVVRGPVTPVVTTALREIHEELDRGPAAGTDLGCVYVDEALLGNREALHPTWTHGVLVERILSGVTRAELVRHGYAVLGRPPATVLAAVSDDDVRAAARAELTGYWAMASRRPHWWLDPVLAELGLTSMARGRHELATGQLLTKTAAIEHVDGPDWVVEHLRRRRRGEEVRAPRVALAWVAWRDARRTTRAARLS